MFIFNLNTQNLPKTYSALARRVLVEFLNLTNIRLYFDIYESPSIKDVNRKYRGDIETEGEFWILKIPSNCNELLKISSFKSSSLIFRWRNIKILHIFRDGRKRVLLLFWQRMQNILFCAWFFEIRNNSKIIWGSPRRQYKIIFHEIHASWKTWRYQKSWQYRYPR